MKTQVATVLLCAFVAGTALAGPPASGSAWRLRALDADR